MTEPLRFRLPDTISLLLILAIAATTRVWFIVECAEQGQGVLPLHVQGALPPLPLAKDVELRGRPNPNELDNLVHNLTEHHWYGSLAPLANEEEQTAHVAPGYPWLLALVARWSAQPDVHVRWGQCVLGVLTVGCYYLFARRAFHNRAVALLVGLFGAINPWWIVSVAELRDGVVASFLVGLSLVFGARASQAGGAFASFLFGLALACLAMVRAALLPFAVVALLWFLLCSRSLRLGWFCGLLAFLGFANGLAPWTMRNYRVFGEPIPVVDSAYWHLWLGNNPHATGGTVDENLLRAALPPERLQEMLAEPNQARRYKQLARPVVEEIMADPAATLSRRLRAGLFFFFGESWFRRGEQVWRTPGAEKADHAPLAGWVIQSFPGMVQGTMLAQLLLALLGWRWSYSWRRESALATLAAIWIPLPYVLSHADALVGPRLPLDGVLWCFAAFALVYLVPGLRQQLMRGPESEEPQQWYGPGSI